MRNSDRVYEEIVNMLLRGDVKCGEPVNDKELCEKLKVGKTPLREALMRLVENGYITEIPRKGMTYVNLSLKELHSIFKLRLCLVEYLGKLLIDEITDVKIQELEDLVRGIDGCEKECMLKIHYEIDLKFHKKLSEIANDKYLTEILDRLQNLSFITLESIYSHNTDTGEEIKREFTKVINGLKEKDRGKVISALKNHIPKYIIQYS